MRKLICSFILVLTACSVNEKKLDGAYEIFDAHPSMSASAKDSVRTLTIFKNEYWISTSFTQGTILKCSGGIYYIKNEHCIQKVNFSEDTSVIGKEYSHEFHPGNQYLIAAFAAINTGKKDLGEAVCVKVSTDEVLKIADLEGIWVMIPEQAGYTDNRIAIRIFAYPSFIRAIYSLKEKQFINAYGGIYQFDGNELIEKVEYSNYEIPAWSRMEWSVKKLDGNKIQLFDIDSFNDEEIFDRKYGE